VATSGVVPEKIAAAALYPIETPLNRVRVGNSSARVAE
jgi:hypothetical protein